MEILQYCIKPLNYVMYLQGQLLKGYASKERPTCIFVHTNLGIALELLCLKLHSLYLEAFELICRTK